MSSRPGACLSPTCPRRSGKGPIPELLAEAEARYDKLARAWCLKEGIDYEATVKNYLDHCGPPLQERNDPIPNAGNDYTIYLPKESS